MSHAISDLESVSEAASAEDVRAHAPEKSQPVSWLLWLLVPISLALAVSRQSLWIDEGFSAWFASRHGFGSFFRVLVQTPTGDAQMLFYLSYLWGWVKIFGHSELALRAANVPFFLLLIGSAAWASRRFVQRPYLWVLFCVSPFVWFYLNEARPYAAVTAFSTVAIVALVAYVLYPAEHASWAPWCCLVALLLACGSHILGVFLIPVMIVVVAENTRQDPVFRYNFWHDWKLPFLCCLPVFAVLGSFYAWISFQGGNRTLGNPGLPNLAFAAYEFLGLEGLGPPRNQMRGGIHWNVIAGYWFWLLIGVVTLATLLVALVRRRSPAMVRVLALGLIAGLAVALAISKVTHFQLLGRHLAALFPVVLLIGMFWLADPIVNRTGRSIAGLTLMLAMVWGLSSARLALLPQYRKDDYRHAVTVALRHAGKGGGYILWVADSHTAHYYGIEVMKDKKPGEIGSNDGLSLPVQSFAVDARHWSAAEVSNYFGSHSGPAILVLSKPDLYDEKGAWQALIQETRPALLAQLNSFSIYQIDKRSNPAAFSLPE